MGGALGVARTAFDEVGGVQCVGGAWGVARTAFDEVGGIQCVGGTWGVARTAVAVKMRVQHGFDRAD